MTTIILDTTEKAIFFDTVRLRRMLELELKGLKGRGPSAYSRLKAMGYKGNRETVYATVSAYVDGVLGK